MKKLSESLWADVQNQAAGSTVKKEDDIERLDMVGLYEYIKSHYELTDKQSEITYGTSNLAMRISNNGDEIYVAYGFGEVHFFFDLYKYPKLEDAVSKQFNVDTNDYQHYFIKPKGKRSNQFFLDVLDCVIANRKSFLRKKVDVNESLWADVQSQAAGSTVKKEDNIERLDMVGLYEYILAHYELTDKRREMTYGTSNMAIDVSSKGDEVLLTYPWCEVHLYFDLLKYRALYNELEKKFELNKQNGLHYVVSPKKFKESNKFYINVLDCIIANKSDCILRRKENVNESLWADIQSQAAGETEKKEDNIEKLSFDDFADYLERKYTPTSHKKIFATTVRNTNSHIEKKEIVIPVESTSTNSSEFVVFTYLPDYDERKPVSVSQSLFNKYPDMFKSFQEKYDTRRIGIVSPKNGEEITYQFYLDVLNDVLSFVQKPLLTLTESLWADVQNQASGVEKKKEDDIEHLDRDGLFSHILSIYKRKHAHPLPLKPEDKNYFSIPLFESEFGIRLYSIYVKFNRKKISAITISADPGECDEFMDVLKERFNVILGGNKGIFITSKEGEVTNELCMEVIKTVLEHSSRPNLIIREN